MRLKALAEKSLFTDVDASTLAVFRIAFGAVLLFWTASMLLGGAVETLYSRPLFFFTYPGFGWVAPLPGWGMYAVFGALGLSCLGILLGLFYRLSAALFTLLFTYVFLIDSTTYQNHYYLICILGAIFAITPAHHALSLDARRRPRLATGRVRGWQLFLMRFQLAIPYVFGAIAKIDGDWLGGQPMGLLLAERAERVGIAGSLFLMHWTRYFFSWSGFLFDLLVVPGLMCRRTRKFAVAALVFFHLTNSFLFTIDIFPYLMLSATIVFLEPDWARRTWPFRQLFAGASVGTPAPVAVTTMPPDLRVLVPLALWALFQIVAPLRQFLIPGDVSWHEVGHFFSWRMLVRHKDGDVIFIVRDPTTNRTWEEDPRRYLSERQVTRMTRRPDSIWQFSQFLADRLSSGRPRRVEIRVGASISLNGRRPQLMIRPDVDLAAAERDPLAWVLPLTERLPE